MPQLVRTPEEILRETGQDMYFIRFADGIEAQEHSREPAGRGDLVACFKANLPNMQLKLFGPSEFSGIVSGCIGADWYLANCTPTDIFRFLADWKFPDGKSIDQRFQCIHYQLQTYTRRLAEQGDPLPRLGGL